MDMTTSTRHRRESNPGRADTGGGPFRTRAGKAGDGAWTALTRSLAGCLLILLSGTLSGCDHDAVALDSHPLDIVGATGRGLESLHIRMSDGVRVAVDVHIPRDYPGGEPFPTILEMTRYWRDRGEDLPFFIEQAVRRGFVYVVMDERGTGASFGSWPAPLTGRSLQDAGEVMDWIVEQPWSNGRIGATGVSYPGMAAQQLASLGHPALQAIVPMSDSYDLYEDLLFPGGLFNEAFARGWSDLVYAMDRNRSVEVEGAVFSQRPVNDDPSGALLDAAIAGHGANLNLFDAVSPLAFRGDAVAEGRTLDEMSTRARASGEATSQVAVYHWGSWMDAGSADGAIRAFMESTGPRRGTIGAWTHGLSRNAYSGLDRWPPVPRLEVQWAEALNFFDDELRKGKPLEGRILRYFTMEENRWKSTSEWPIPGTVTESWYLGPQGTLSPGSPPDVVGADPYHVDFTAASSTESRWLSPLFADTWYPDRMTRDHKLLIYESDPLPADLEVTGYPVVHLHLSSTHADGAFIVYLEDVTRQGRTTYVTEGLLRGIHRKASEDPARWTRPTPYHSFLEADARPLVPGEVAELAFGLHPTSFLFKEGHRIRIAIAGHDASALRRVPEVGDPTLTLRWGGLQPSSIDLPVIPREAP